MPSHCFCRQRARLAGSPVLFYWEYLLSHSRIMAGLEWGKCIIPECTKEYSCLYSSVCLASNPICIEIAERNCYIPVDCNYLSYSSSSCQKEIKLQIHPASSSKLLIFLLSVDRKVVSLEWKQTKALL